jgi:lactoylglutathione lyase
MIAFMPIAPDDPGSGPQPLGSFSHLRLDVQDIDSSVAFYRDVIGLRQVVRYETPQRTIVQMGADGRLPGIELWHEPWLGPPPPSRVHIAFWVADVDEAHAEAVRRGARVLTSPFQIDDERIAFLSDPDGYPIELHHVEPGL